MSTTHNQFSQGSDEYFMQEALLLAEKGRYTCDPNPMVGAVIVKNNQVIGQGFHAKAGQAHAEVNAIEHALQQHPMNQSLAGTTLYVTLEPCAHQGRTPPCCTLIEQYQIQRIVIASADPNPLVKGKSIARLQHHCQVSIGVLETAALELNHSFFYRMGFQRPWVQLKIAASLDGRIALANGQSQWITGPAARRDVHQLRLNASAIATGSGTFMHDNPRLDARQDMLGFTPERQPLRIILDQRLRTPPKLLQQQPFQDTLLVTGLDQLKTAQHYTQQMAQLECIAIDQKDGALHLAELLPLLHLKNINSLLIEAGSTLAGYCLNHDLVNEIILYFAPTWLGQDSKAMLELPALEALPDRHQWQFQHVELIGESGQQDLKVVLRKVNPPSKATQSTDFRS